MEDNNTEEPAESDIENIENLLDDDLEDSSDTIHNLRKIPKIVSLEYKRKLGNSINSVLSEYVDSYILCGFDTNGNSIVLVNSNSNLESRALSDLLNDFVESNDHSYRKDDDDDDD